MAKTRRERLRAFFKYFGAKHRLAPKYPEPQHDLIIEPFAGSAAYATYHGSDPSRRVQLYDINDKVVDVWRYLIAAGERPEAVDLITSLPTRRMGEGEHVLEYAMGFPDEAHSLIGFWLRTGSPNPRAWASPWALDPNYRDRFWGEEIRNRLAEQVPYLRTWSIEWKSYEDIENQDATWFIDPPYWKEGKAYLRGSRDIDYPALACWCRERKGLAIVCEQEGADWLPFRPFASVRTNVNAKGMSPRTSKEVVCVLENGIDLTDSFLSSSRDRGIFVGER